MFPQNHSPKRSVMRIMAEDFMADIVKEVTKFVSQIFNSMRF